MNKLFIPVVLGTARSGRQSENVAKFIHAELMKRDEVETVLIDVADFLFAKTVPGWVEDALASKWREIVSKSDGLIIVAPEYNRGYPGELKLLLDSAYGEYAKKPVGLVGVSGGPFGGTAVIEQLKQVLVELSLVVVRDTVRFSSVEKAFDEKGNLQEVERYVKQVSNMADSLLWHAKALKEARESN